MLLANGTRFNDHPLTAHYSIVIMVQTVPVRETPATASLLLQELKKPTDASDLTELQAARLEAVKLRALVGELARSHYPELLSSSSSSSDEPSSKPLFKSGSSSSVVGEPMEDDEEEWANLRTDPAVALRRLKAGNARFVAGVSHHPHTGPGLREHLAAAGQFPYCTVLGCSDSRAPVSLVFDGGVGDLFCVNVAGNVVSDANMATIEYGVEHLHTPLLLVLGHTCCGAVTACVKQAKVGGFIPKLLAMIEPAASRAAQACDCDNDVVPRAIVENVWEGVQQCLEKSKGVRDLVMQGKLSVQGGVYHIQGGHVDFFGEHPQQEDILAAITAKASSE